MGFRHTFTVLRGCWWKQFGAGQPYTRAAGACMPCAQIVTASTTLVGLQQYHNICHTNADWNQTHMHLAQPCNASGATLQCRCTLPCCHDCKALLPSTCNIGLCFQHNFRHMMHNASMAAWHVWHCTKLFVWFDRMQSRRAAKMSCLTSTTSCWNGPRMTPRATTSCLWTLLLRYVLPTLHAQCTV